MKVRDIINRLTSGGAHLLLVSDETGEVFLKTIWYNEIPKKFLDCEINHITIKDYEITLIIKDE